MGVMMFAAMLAPEPTQPSEITKPTMPTINFSAPVRAKLLRLGN